MNYRSEIDGLRAVAVLPVMFFHAGLPFFSGGFVGVDIFFVISGYLITSIILGELNGGTFTIAGFYERRARRILPALFLIMGLTFLAGFFILLPEDMKDFSGSMAAAATFWSNIYFWQGSGYFAAPAELKPLLHTWSLGVEEQYYILYPLFLMLAWGLGRKKILLILGALFALSLTGAHLGALNHSAGVFFLLPTRCWELLLGIFAAFYLSQPSAKTPSPATLNILGLGGLVMIAAAIFTFTDETPTPGLPLLLPTLGALFIILFAKPGTLAAKLLSLKPVIGIGLISYSAYLWHQPLFAFAKYHSGGIISPLMLAGLCALTLPLSYLSWRFVEKPFRRKDGFSRRFVFTFAALGIALFTALGAAGYASNGFEKIWQARKTPLEQQTYLLTRHDARYDNFGADEKGIQDNGDCRFNIPALNARMQERLSACAEKYGPGILILGDSHAIDLFGAVTLASKNKFIAGLTSPGCRPHPASANCPYLPLLSFIKERPHAFSHLIFSQSGRYLLQKEGEPVTEETLKWQVNAAPLTGLTPYEGRIGQILDYLKDVSAFVPVLWFGPRVEPQISKTDILRQGCNYEFHLRPGLRESFDALDRFIGNKTAALKNISYLSQNEAYALSFPADFMSCEKLFWADGSHFSAQGEERFGQRFDLIHYLNNKN